MTIYALDTNIVSFMLKGDFKVLTAYQKAVETGLEIIIPVVVYYEIRRGLLAVNATAQMNAFGKLCDTFIVEEMSVASWEKAAQIWFTLRKQGTPIGKDDGDIFIAAHCLVNDYTLITDNKSDFERIDGLKIVNWKE